MHFNPDNKFMLTGDVGTEGNMMLNMMWEIHCTSTKRQPECIEMSGAYYIRFDFLLGGIAMLTWLKAILMLRLTEKYGPVIKMIMKMIQDLLKFFVIWFFVIFMFVCVAALIFGELHSFHEMSFIMYNYIESSLGNWDLGIYDDVT